jgi:hypothetical protein
MNERLLLAFCHTANVELLRPNGQLSEKIGKMVRKCPQIQLGGQYGLVNSAGWLFFPAGPAFCRAIAASGLELF